jgi:hypothetical protein
VGGRRHTGGRPCGKGAAGDTVTAGDVVVTDGDADTAGVVIGVGVGADTVCAVDAAEEICIEDLIKSFNFNHSNGFFSTIALFAPVEK